MAYQSCIYEVANGIATLRLNNSEKLNALTFQTYEELERLFADLAHDGQVKVVIITGSGKGFCSGGSVHEIIGKLIEMTGADMGALYLLPRVVGLARATELLFLGDAIDAQEAYRIGVANRVVQHEKLWHEAHELARRLKQGPLNALGVTKDLLEREANMDLESALNLEAAAQTGCIETADFKEGYRAFVEKRAPVFNRS